MTNCPPLNWSEFDNWWESVQKDQNISYKLLVLKIQNSEKFKKKYFFNSKEINQQIKKLKEVQAVLAASGVFGHFAKQIIVLISNMENTRDTFDSNAPEPDAKKTGKKGYPPELAEKIYEIIDLAKGDRTKQLCLVDFFKSGGCYDKWIKEKTADFLTGPSRKPRINGEVVADPKRIEDLEWLKDFKKNQKNISRKTRRKLRKKKKSFQIEIR